MAAEDSYVEGAMPPQPFRVRINDHLTYKSRNSGKNVRQGFQRFRVVLHLRKKVVLQKETQQVACARRVYRSRTLHGRIILVRFVFSSITPNFGRSE
jgi:hypothetical protein